MSLGRNCKCGVTDADRKAAARLQLPCYGGHDPSAEDVEVIAAALAQRDARARAEERETRRDREYWDWLWREMRRGQP